MDNILSVQNLYAYYKNPEILALRGVTIEVRENEIIAIIGPNGAGKSTVLKTIFKEAKIKSGILRLKGEDIILTPPENLVKMGIGYLPEGRRLFGSLTVEENLDLGGYILSDRGKIRENKERIYGFFPVLKNKRKRPAKKLSGGEQQLLSFARVLMFDPLILLMDEPSLGLAPKIITQIFENILTIRELGIVIVLVEQNVKKALSVADRVYVLNLGQVVFEGRPDEISGDERLKKTYLGG